MNNQCIRDLLKAKSLGDAESIVQKMVAQRVRKAAAADLALRSTTPDELLRVAELRRLLEGSARSVAGTFARRREVLEAVAHLLDCTSWLGRDSFLQQNSFILCDSPATALTWLEGYAQSERQLAYLARVGEALLVAGAAAPFRGLLAAHSSSDQILMLVEDLIDHPDTDSHFALIDQYAFPFKGSSDADIERALAQAYQRADLSAGQRRYLVALLQRCQTDGVAATKALFDIAVAALMDLTFEADQGVRTAAFERAAMVQRDLLFTIAEYLRGLFSDAGKLAVADKLEKEFLTFRMARKCDLAEAAERAKRKRALTLDHLMRFLRFEDRWAQLVYLKANRDTILSSHCAHIIEGIVNRLGADDGELRKKLRVAAIFLDIARRGDLEGAIESWRKFDCFLELVDSAVAAARAGDAQFGEWIARAEGIAGDEGENFDSPFFPVLRQLLPLALESDTFGSKFLFLAALVDRAAFDRKDLPQLMIAALESALTAPTRVAEELLGPTNEMLGNLQVGQAETDEQFMAGIDQLEKALEIHQAAGGSNDQARVHTELARAYAGLADRKVSSAGVEIHSGAALELVDKIEDPEMFADAATLLAENLQQQGSRRKLARAAAILEQAVDSTPRDSPHAVRRLWTRSRILKDLGRRREAIRSLQAALGNSRLLRAGAVRRRSVQLSGEFLIQELAMLMFEVGGAGEGRQVLTEIEQVKGDSLAQDGLIWSLGNSVEEMATAAATSADDLRKGLETLRELYSLWIAEPELWDSFAQTARAAIDDLPGAIRELATSREYSHEEEKPFEQVLDFAQNLEEENPEWREVFKSMVAPDFAALSRLEEDGELPGGTPRPPFGWDSIQSYAEILGERAALASYLVCPDRILCLLVRKGWSAPEPFAIPLPEVEWVNRYWLPFVDDILARGASTGPPGRHRHSWQSLGEELLGPLEPFLSDCDVVYVSGDQRLFWIPFHALHVEGVAYCRRRATISIPSFEYGALRSTSRLTPQRLGAVAAVGYSRDHLESETFEEEARQVADYFGSSLRLLGAQAQAAGLREIVRQGPGLLHLSVHGEFVGGEDGVGLLKLADGDFSAVDWMKLRGQSEICTFSACEAGRSELSSRFHYGGFSRAAMLSGAAAILAPIWPVRTDLARRFCLDFYAQTWTSGGERKLQKAEGYRRALVNLAEETDHDPYLWASFLFSGDGS